MSLRELINQANEKAVDNMQESEPYLIDTALAKDAIPGLKDRVLLHAGPPISWESASGPLRGALIGATIYEGWASSEHEAESMLRRNEIVLKPTHECSAVGPMAGVISPSMPVYIVEDKRFGNVVYSNYNEGLGRVLRFGAYDEEVIKRLIWIRDEVFPAVRGALRRMRSERGGLALKPIIQRALHMGDDGHNRNLATSHLFLVELAPYLASLDLPRDVLHRIWDFMKSNPLLALNIVMAASKAMSLAAHNIEYSTIVTVMSRNGSEFGIWVSGLGNRWFTSSAPTPRGVLFPGYTQEDANPDLGDSSITETVGLGAFAMASAPAIVSYIGGTVEFAIEVTKKMYNITYTRHKYFTIPYLGFQGTPTGIDLRLVLKTGITPMINTGIAHKKPGVGQIGAGIVEAPFDVFVKAFRAYVEFYGV